jgi:hypothetical protein
MGWNYSRYIDHVAEAGKREYPIPMYVNAWIVQPADKGPGDYPSGGPQDHMHDIWRAGAPHLDMLSPDIYLPDFIGLTARYSRNGNPLFIPESSGDIHGAANAFYVIGQHNGMGYSSMGIDSVGRMLGRAAGSPELRASEMPDIENLPLPMAYRTLAQIAPMILEHQSSGTIAAASVDKANPDVQVKVGDYLLDVGLPRNFRALSVVPDLTGYGIFMQVGPDEFYLAGNNLQVAFTPATPGPPIAGLAWQECGRFEGGKWVATRYLAGDDSVLRYDMAVVAGMNQSGSGVRLTAGARGIQRVKLYRYK